MSLHSIISITITIAFIICFTIKCTIFLCILISYIIITVHIIHIINIIWIIWTTMTWEVLNCSDLIFQLDFSHIPFDSTFKWQATTGRATLCEGVKVCEEGRKWGRVRGKVREGKREGGREGGRVGAREGVRVCTIVNYKNGRQKEKVRVHLHLDGRTCTSIDIQTWVHLHVYAYTCNSMYVCVHVHLRIYMYVCACIHECAWYWPVVASDDEEAFLRQPLSAQINSTVQWNGM